jgi:hypothetical protein
MLETRAKSPAESEQVPAIGPDDFSLVGGGLLGEIRRRMRLSGDVLDLTRWRVLVTVAFAWVPLLLLSIAEGRAWGSDVALTFLHDAESQARSLIAIPLLILAEGTFHRQLAPIVRCFVEDGLVPESARTRFDAAVASAMRLRNSVLAELLLVILVYVVGILIVRRTQFVLDVDTWYASSAGGIQRLTAAGWWGAFVSMPIVQFLVVRWYFRFFIWARFQWQVSRIKLDLKPTHPDGTAGLHFLSLAEHASRPVMLALGVVLSAMIANKILYTGATLFDFKVEIVGTVTLLVFMILGPMLVFSPQLIAAKHTGIEHYGRLGQQYASDFESKWMGEERPTDEPLLGSADIQSLADLRNACAVVSEIHVTPFEIKNVVVLAAVTLAPCVPLVFTVFSIDEVVDRLLKTIF